MTLRQALTILDRRASLSPVTGTWLTPQALLDRLPDEWLAAPVRLTGDRLAYTSLDGHSVGGWSVRWMAQDLRCAVPCSK